MANDDSSTGNGIYPYSPNKMATIIMAGLFGASALYHLVTMIRKKTWFYSSFIVGAFMMTIGYIARYFSAQSPLELGPYIMQSLFIILPPSLYAATIYMIYGRIVILVNAPRASMIRPTRVTKIFVCGDVVSFFMQAGGGGMMAQASMSSLGQKIMLLGLFVQLLFFGFFLTISLVFWKRMQSSAKLYTVPREGKHTWKALIKLLFGAAFIIILRCIYRIIEFAQGTEGYFSTHEIYMYIFDAAPMFVVQAMFHCVHAGDVFPSSIAAPLEGDNEGWINLQQTF
ncbi:putative RTA1 domain protein [Penicillium brasilianum]|uniref:Putative RTA1 domain protein n=1 Tax=Penicillium brasilianum TaxID=104259 RepID=A0A1S9R8M6_PENBI|nr:putative RTA1 domain protein [Penicillium brasilianum]